MDKKEQILHYHRIDGLSLREISRRVGLNRKTVTRYIREYEARVQADPEEGVDLCLASEPRYPARKAERTRLTEPVCTEIEYWLHMKSNEYHRQWVNSYFWRTKQQQEVDYLEEGGGKLSAYEIKWNPRTKASLTKTFAEAYPNTELEVITPENITDFLI